MNADPSARPWPGARLIGWPQQLTTAKASMLALAAGASVPLSLAPFEIWPLSILAALVLLATLTGRTPKQGFIIGWCYGLGLFGVGVSWVYNSIHVYGQAPVPLAAGLTALFAGGLALLKGFFGYLWCRWFDYSPSHKENHTAADQPLLFLFAWPVVWIAIDSLQIWFLTGFPWLFLGYAHLASPLSGWAPVVGVHGLTFISVLIAALLFACLHSSDRKRRIVCLNAGLLLVFMGVLLQGIEWAQPAGKPIQATLVQPNIPQEIKWQPGQAQITLDTLVNLTRNHLDSDLVVWPENAIPVFHHQAQGYLTDLSTLAQQSNTAIISGLPYWHQDPATGSTIHNSLVAIGTGQGLYHKRKLVPFGEYVPLQDWLRGIISFFDLPMSDFRTGPADQPLLTMQTAGTTLSINPAICYEIVYPDFVRRHSQDAQLILTVSDDSWFGTTIGPIQHLQMAQMRALENGRPVIRATNTGLTAFINPQGEVYQQADAYTATAITDTVTPMTGHTPFGRFGSWPLWVLCAMYCGYWLIVRK